MLTRILQIVSTGLGVGYLPAPGTCATLLIGLPLVVVFHNYLNLTVLSIVTLVAIAIVHGALPLPGAEMLHDPQYVVLDEIIGLLWTFRGRPCTPVTLFTGTVLFRFFDISKVGPIGWAEQLPGAVGIMADDVVAGMVANIALGIFA